MEVHVFGPNVSRIEAPHRRRRQEHWPGHVRFEMYVGITLAHSIADRAVFSHCSLIVFWMRYRVPKDMKVKITLRIPIVALLD